MEEDIKSLVHCIVFPPKLPQEGTDNPARQQSELVKFWLDSISEWRSISNQMEGNHEAFQKFAQSTANLHSSYHFVPGSIASALKSLQLGDGLAMYVREQNCGILFRRQDETHITLEMFEASAENNAVMSSSTPLQREFPGTVLELETEFLWRGQVLRELSEAIADLAMHPVEIFVPTVCKAGNEVSEIRDTPFPGAIIEVLIPALLAYGQIVPTALTTKKVRDEVCWKQALLPWRRPPLWTVLRVATQRWLERTMGTELGWHLYKNIQIVILTNLCRLVIPFKSLGEELFYVRAKLARRLDKLRQLDSLDSKVEDYACAALEQANCVMKTRWNQIIDENSRRVIRCQQANTQDTFLLLKNSRGPMEKKLEPIVNDNAPSYSGPPVAPFRRTIIKNCRQLDVFDFAPGELDLFVSLYDFELQVEVLNCEASVKNCRAIEQMFTRYERASAKLHASNADCTSIRLLTLIELWVQLDRITLELEPMMCKLTPDIPENFMRHLRLPDLSHFGRVQKIEEYINLRSGRTSAQHRLSPFTDSTMIDFANRYYDDGKTGAFLRETHARINRDTDAFVEKKRTEWKSKEEKCRKWQEEASKISHNQYQDQWDNWHCRPYCYLCNLTSKISGLTIEPFEEPLPQKSETAKWVLFELLCPDIFHIWREVTWKVVNDLGRQGESVSASNEISCWLTKYSGLRVYHSCRDLRISPVSQKKSFSVAHYGKAQKVANTSFHKVHLSHGPSYFLFDENHPASVKDLHKTSPVLLRHYPGLLPEEEKYAHSKAAITTTLHTPNDVISRQSQCHQYMSLFEFYSFNILRSGESLQWLNVLVELASRNLEFAEDATDWLICQAALEIGTSTANKDVLRKSHRWFHYVGFCDRLLQLLLIRVETVRSNWKELTHLRVLLVLTLHLETLAPHFQDVQQGCNKIRVLIRESSCEWTRQLRQNISNSQSGTSTSLLRSTMLSAALLCRATYTSVDELHSWSPYFECGFLVASESPAVLEDASCKLRHNILHNWEVSCKLEQLAAKNSQDHPEQLSAAVGILWEDGKYIRHWKSLEAPNTRWLWAQTEASHHKKPMQVHVNVLTGELLVNGKCPDRLPKKYLEHRQYRELFGSRQFEILPSSVRGMTFAAKTMDGSFHFSWDNAGIQIGRETKDGNLDILLHRSIFSALSCSIQDLPSQMINDQVHWLRLTGNERGIMRICPRTRALALPQREDWALNFQSRYAVRQGSRLLEPNCDQVTQLAEMIGCFESRYNLIVSIDQENRTTMSLPRFGLIMQLNMDGQLCCPDLNGTITESQNASTLIGLRGHLVMSDQKTGSRFVIVPHGRVTISPQGQHIQASINAGQSSYINFSKFSLNDCLGRFDCNAESRDMLYKAYLHAVTSGYLPDPLIGRRGTDEALEILRELHRQLYSPLDSDVHDLLRDLADLTPTRNFYPEHLQVMQTSDWHSALASTSQVDDFRDLIETIIDRSNALKCFYEAPEETDLELMHTGSSLLHKRSRIRNSKFYSPSLGIYTSSESNSKIYCGRDHLHGGERVKRVYEIALLVKSWTADIQSTQNLGADLSGKGDLDCFNKDFKTMTTSSLFSLNVIPIIGSVIRMCSTANREIDQIRFLFFFPTLAYSENSNMKLLRSLLSIAFNNSCHTIRPPPWTTYVDFRVWEYPSQDWLYRTLIDTDITPIAPPLYRGRNESWYSFQSRQQSANAQHRNAAEVEARRVARLISQQWPYPSPRSPQSNYLRISYGAAALAIQEYWERIWQNWKLSEFLKDISSILQSRRDNILTDFPAIPKSTKAYIDRRQMNKSYGNLLLEALETTDAPQRTYHQTTAEWLAIEMEGPFLHNTSVSKAEMSSSDNSGALDALKVMLGDARISRNNVRFEFVSKLQGSLRSLHSVRDTGQDTEEGTLKASADLLQMQIDKSEELIQLRLSDLIAQVEAHPRFKHLQLGGLWPRMTIADMLQVLCRFFQRSVICPAREKLMDLALLVIRRQRLRRILRYLQQDDKVRLIDEITNSKHTWDVRRYTPWLILEIEMDVCIRKEQADMALSMAHPEGESNAIYQLQMGKGKSSLIIPMLAAFLSRKDRLFRVVVTKPLLHQMGAILKQRLCRLLQRPLLHIPFSRATPKDPITLQTYRSLHEVIMNNSGVALALPEHIQSLQLSGLQCLLDRRLDAGRSLITSFRWIGDHARDVLDECDHILAPRTQLIYPSGAQSLVDGGAGRWETIALVLRDLFRHIDLYKHQNPDHLEIEPHRPGGFPFIYVRSERHGQHFINYLVEKITVEKSPYLPLERLRSEEVTIVRRCLKNGPLSDATMEMLESRFQDDNAVKFFLVLRGLLGGGILLLTLQKRWNVHYGLHLDRCQIAVPYLARGRPSPASEYGHPDVALTLTYLAYYHQGLRQDQLNLAIEKLRLEHDPYLEWDQWIRYSYALPDELRSWDAVNLDDENLMFSLWKGLSHALPTVNYYLSRIVFPRAAREFERKLVSSSWDIPLQTPRITTGFSGTNDNALLMPDSIHTRDLPSQGHTNAEVLWHLLKFRNREYELAANQSREALPVEALLQFIYRMEVDVLLDAGALVLEMDNVQVASEWLERRPDVKAAVYFNEDGLLCVIHRNGRVELLSKSRYASNLDECLLYLDEEHCRGTDMKLPSQAKAALTIGPKQPKDQTVQAAMRMRQLAHGQSIVFLAPPSVDNSIRDFCGLGSADKIDSRHVISWSIEQSCIHIESQISLWKSQKRSYQSRKANINAVYLSDGDAQVNAIDRVPEKEKRSLRELYGPYMSLNASDHETTVLVQTEQDHGQVLDHACAEEEQERQVDQEVQEEQNRENPEPEKPCKHSLHPDVQDLVLRGVLHEGTSAYRSVFAHMAQTRLFSDLISRGLTRLEQESRVLVTEDFCRTVKTFTPSGTYRTLRPVRYIAWTRLQPSHLLIISPFEAEELLYEVAKSSHAHILLYEAPRTRGTSEYFNSLAFFGIPRLPSAGEISACLRQELFLYAGGLFFPWSTGEELRSYIRLLNRTLDPQNAVRGPSDIGVQFAELWRNWLQMRLHGMDGMASPAGYMIRDKALDQADRMFCT